MEWETHALASQAAARANATPWLKELNPYMVRVILPFAETKAFLKEGKNVFDFPLIVNEILIKNYPLIKISLLAKLPNCSTWNNSRITKGEVLISPHK